MKILLSISLTAFLLSTFSYRAAFISFLIVFFIYAISIFNVNSKVALNKKATILAVIVLVLTILLSLSQQIYILYYIKMAAMIFYVVLLCSLLTSKVITKCDLLFCFKCVVWINASCFLLQFSVHEIFGYFIDFNNFIREEKANTIYTSRSLETFILGIRATGLYSEPSFYAMSIFPVSILTAVYDKRFNKTLIIAFFTCLLSLSIAAIVIVLLSSLVFYKELKNNKYVLAIVFISLLVSIPLLYDFVISRLYVNADYDAIGSRMLVFTEFLQRPLFNDIFGSGFFWDANKPIGVTELSGAKIRDSSFYVYTYFTGGVIGLIMLTCLIFLYLPQGWKIKYVFTCSLLFKFGILTAAFWFLIAFIVVLSYQEKTINN